MKKIVIIGSGINGLVASNYLAKENYDVTVIEKNSYTGGACIKDSAVIENKVIDFAYGPTVLGMMPDFIFSETGLDKSIVTSARNDNEGLELLKSFNMPINN